MTRIRKKIKAALQHSISASVLKCIERKLIINHDDHHNILYKFAMLDISRTSQANVSYSQCVLGYVVSMSKTRVENS